MRFPMISTLLAIATIALSSAPLAAQTVDPAVVGTWESMVPGPQGLSRWIWEIHADGTYTFTSDPPTTPAHSGTIIFGNGQWVLTATQGNPGWSDAGTYQIQPTTLLASGKSGVVLWQKSGSAGAPAQSTWPADFPGKVQLASTMAQKWNADAVLIEAHLELKPPTLTPFAPGDEYNTTFAYYSPAQQQRLSIIPGNPAGELFPAGYYDHSDRVPIPERFMDLDAAVEWSHLLGMSGRAERADLTTWDNTCGTAGVGWMIWAINAQRTYTIPAAIVAPGSSEAIKSALTSDQAAMIEATSALLPPGYQGFSMTDVTLTDDMRKDGITAYLQQSFPNAGKRDLLIFKIYGSHDAAEADFGQGQLQQKHLLKFSDGSDRGIEATCSVSIAEELVLACEHLSPTLPVTVAGASFEAPRDIADTEYQQIWNTRTGRVMLAGALYRRMVCGE